MSNTFNVLRENQPLRLLGLVVGLAPGGCLLLLGGSGGIDPGLRAATIVLGATLGWIFAPRAASPGWHNGLQAVLAISLWAVVLGSFLVVALSMDYGATDPSAWIPTILAAGVLGLIFLGVPMMIVTFVVATVWVGAVKLGVRLRLVGLIAPPSATS